MGYVRGEARKQETMFPVTLEELVPEDHVCRVIDAFVEGLNMAASSGTAAAATGRPGYDPRDTAGLLPAYNVQTAVDAGYPKRKQCEIQCDEPTRCRCPQIANSKMVLHAPQSWG